MSLDCGRGHSLRNAMCLEIVVKVKACETPCVLRLW